jgi:hypothetical protein
LTEVRTAFTTGASADEVHFRFSVGGAELRTAEITALLGCVPTYAHERGDLKRNGIQTYSRGVWDFRIERKAPVSLDELVDELFEHVACDDEIVRQLTSKYEVVVGFTLFFTTWSSGFRLSPRSMQRLSALGVPISFGIYAEAGQEE